MRGLLLKDFYMIWKHFKTFFLIGAVFIAVSFTSEDNVFAHLPIMLAAIIPITLLAYDERSGWTEYCGALPYSKAQIVSAKYLVGLIMQAAAMLVVFIALLIRAGVYPFFEIMDALKSMLALFDISLILPAVCMPFSLRYGTEKGRMMYYIVIAAVAGTVALIAHVSNRLLIHNPHLIFIYAAAIPVLYVLSWVYSIVIYKNKELGK